MGFRWVKDQKVESNLRQMGVVFDTTTVPRTSLDLDEGLRRQARMIGKLNEDAVLTMAVDMAKEGAAFPMPILQKPPHGGKMWPWSGNHRLAAYFLAFPDATHVDAYLVTIKDPVMLDLLPRVVNAWESQLGFSKEEKIVNARWMVDNHSMAPAEAARLFGLKVDWLWKANQVEETRSAVLDIPKANGLPKSILIKLHPMLENRNVLNATVRLICSHSLKTDDASHLIADVRNHSTENQMLGEVGRWEKVLEARKSPSKRTKGTVKMTRSVRDAFIRNLTSLAKILQDKDTYTKLQITDPADLAVVERAWKVINFTMRKVEESGVTQ